MVSRAQLLAVMPHLSATKADELLPFLNAAMEEAEIVTRARRAAFLAQVAHESFQLRYFEELASGQDYERPLIHGQPMPPAATHPFPRWQRLGNTERGDGPRFKGRGPIQLTGRANYAACGAALGIDLLAAPELVARPDVGFRASAWYWRTHGLNALADQGDFDAITRAINGGTNGAEDRQRYHVAALEALPEELPPAPAPCPIDLETQSEPREFSGQK